MATVSLRPLLRRTRRRLVPRSQPTPGTGRRAALPASPDGAGLLLFANPSAGEDVIGGVSRGELAARLPLADLRDLDGDAGDAIAAAVRGPRPPRILGVLGGDGSVSAFAGHARRHDLPLLILPGGTFNHFARASGVRDAATGLEALAAGTGLEVPVGELRIDDGEPITVLNAVAAGLYPDFVALRDEDDSDGKWLGGLAALGELARRHGRLVVHVDGRRARVWSVFASIGPNTPGQVSTMQRRDLDDAVLDLRFLAGTTPRHQAFGGMVFGRRTAAALRLIGVAPSAARVDARLTDRIRIGIDARGRLPIAVTHDGEVRVADAGRPVELVIRAVPGALRVYAPERDRPDRPGGPGLR